MRYTALYTACALVVAATWVGEIVHEGWAEFVRQEFVAAIIVLALFGIVYFVRKSWRQ